MLSCTRYRATAHTDVTAPIGLSAAYAVERHIKFFSLKKSTPVIQPIVKMLSHLLLLLLLLLLNLFNRTIEIPDFVPWLSDNVTYRVGQKSRPFRLEADIFCLYLQNA